MPGMGGNNAPELMATITPEWVATIVRNPHNLAKFEAGKLVGVHFSGYSATPAPGPLASGGS